jgi:hypothetical protein
MNENATSNRGTEQTMTDETATYIAAFLCGHQRTYPLPDGLDPDFLAGIAAQRVCPDCALNAYLRARSTDDLPVAQVEP